MNELYIDAHLQQNAIHQEQLEQEDQIEFSERLKMLEHQYGFVIRLIDDLDGIAGRDVFDHLIEVKDGLARQIGYLSTGCYGARIGTPVFGASNAKKK